jgi:hypothetical protein
MKNCKKQNDRRNTVYPICSALVLRHCMIDEKVQKIHDDLGPVAEIAGQVNQLVNQRNQAMSLVLPWQKQHLTGCLT